ncbi:sialomucin core protein 24-like [Kryptolebias marmoratus]|uniref:sialomucin core protein 24-like n=1 Tax=Kryptolebias marmoratus TaxID=37003 RepID=UPI0007F93BB8|nr:sialomucin core protein 24-like [Kryptolebias marmoratus]
METVLASLVCCLLVLSIDVVRMENQDQADKTTENPVLNQDNTSTTATSSNSTVLVTTLSNFTEGTTQPTSTEMDNENFTSTAAPAENTSVFQSSQATLTSLTDSASLKTTTPSSGTPTFTETTHTIYTTPDTPVSPAENSSHTLFTTVNTANRTTQGLNLNVSEKNMTIIFSAVLGVFLLALVMITLHRCRHKIQYMHQPLNSTNEEDGFVADNDTLVISGGLYDGHPIYDNIPPVPSEPSQFRLEFLQ